jgi:hypothetical protein
LWLTVRSLFRRRDASSDTVSAFFYKLMMTVEQRQVDLELALAEARGVPTLHIPLRSGTPMPHPKLE